MEDRKLSRWTASPLRYVALGRNLREPRCHWRGLFARAKPAQEAVREPHTKPIVLRGLGPGRLELPRVLTPKLWHTFAPTSYASGHEFTALLFPTTRHALV